MKLRIDTYDDLLEVLKADIPIELANEIVRKALNVYDDIDDKEVLIQCVKEHQKYYENYKGEKPLFLTTEARNKRIAVLIEKRDK